MRRTLLPGVLIGAVVAAFLFQTPDGLTAKGPWLLYVKLSEDRTSPSNEHFELYPNGKVVWTTPARGGDCAPTAGLFEGSLPPETAQRLAREAIEALESSAKAPGAASSGAAPPGNQVLQAELGGPLRKGHLERLTPKVTRFLDSLAQVEGTLAPRAVVRFETKRQGDRIEVTWRHEGAQSVLLPIPDVASQAFALVGAQAGARLEFVKKPSTDFIELSPKFPTYQVTLKLAGPGERSQKNSRSLRYLTAAIRHHARRATASKGTPAFDQEIALCAPL